MHFHRFLSKLMIQTQSFPEMLYVRVEQDVLSSHRRRHALDNLFCEFWHHYATWISVLCLWIDVWHKHALFWIIPGRTVCRILSTLKPTRCYCQTLQKHYTMRITSTHPTASGETSREEARGGWAFTFRAVRSRSDVGFGTGTDTCVSTTTCIITENANHLS